ncbi:MAG: hypothetical protein NTY19_51340 [Planctomycetota bacterium]|nr:hypothetical protein [Planctomycetota bacterium]
MPAPQANPLQLEANLDLESALTISDDKKVDVILSVMSSVRTHIAEWNSRAYTATSWFVAILLLLPSYMLTAPSSITLTMSDKLILSAGIFVFGVFGQIYLHFAHDALRNNGRALVRCEAVLQLGDPKAYFKTVDFFSLNPKGEWVTAKDIITLRILHFVVLVLSILVFLLLKRG